MKLNRESIGEMVRFSIVGVLVTVIHYAVYWLLQLVIDINIAWTAGYIAGFIVNYFLSAHYIFREKTSAENGAGFGGAHLINYLLQMGLLNFFLWAGLSPTWAPVGVYAVSIPVNFLLVRFVFKHFKRRSKSQAPDGPSVTSEGTENSQPQ